MEVNGAFERYILGSVNPSTREEWQTAVNLAELYQILHAVRDYGLLPAAPPADLRRCTTILRMGAVRGIHPKRSPQFTQRVVPHLLPPEYQQL